jgi:tetratricopeptide (TPR) repeat protein
VVQGGIGLGRDSLRITAMLYDDSVRAVVWSQVFEWRGVNATGPDWDIARQIYDSLAGRRGHIRLSEERIAWAKPDVTLNEYDYYLRGQSLYLRSNFAEVLKARAIYQEGLERYPVSALLRLSLAWTYWWTAMNDVNADPRPDIDQAWRLANEALSAQSRSRLEDWLIHWLMAFLYEWHDEDFPHAAAEARIAAQLAPYDTCSRSELSWVLANAGYGDQAIAWARSALEHDPNGPSRYYANLAWAHYIAGHYQEAVDALRERAAEFPVFHAALLVRLGRLESAKAIIADYLKSGGGDTVEREDDTPLVEPTETAYLEELRNAGLPQK